MTLFATFAYLLPGHPTLSTTFDYLEQRKKTAEKIDTNAQWFHCSWSILLKSVNIRVRGFHLVFYFVPLQITIKPPFGRICFSCFKYLKQIHCYFVGFKLESYPPSPVQKYPATKKQWNSVFLVIFFGIQNSKTIYCWGFFHMFVGVGVSRRFFSQPDLRK